LADRIRLCFELFNARDWDLVARGLPEEFEAVDHLDERSARGPTALKEITAAKRRCGLRQSPDEPLEIHSLPADGERVQVVVRVLASASSELAQVWTFDGGVPIRFEQFRTWDEALAAAGRE
jgi:hypothetical protein